MKARSLESSYFDLCINTAAQCPDDDWYSRYWSWHPAGCVHQSVPIGDVEAALWTGLTNSGVAHLEAVLEDHSLMGEARHEKPGVPPNWTVTDETYDDADEWEEA